MMLQDRSMVYMRIFIYAVSVIRRVQDFMAPKKSSRGDASEYSYVTDEDAEEAPASEAPRVRIAAKAAPKPAAAKAAPESSAPADAGPSDVPERVVTRTHGPPCATSKRRIPSPSTSSDDPGPNLPPRSRSPVRDVPALDARPVRDSRLDEEAAFGRDRSTRPVSPVAEAAPERDGPTRQMDGGHHGMPASRSKGKAKGKRTQECPHCWTPVAWTPRGSGLSQHMWWNFECIAWQMYSQGEVSWDTALHRAHAVKSRREQEGWEEYRDRAREDTGVDVLPASSARHRAYVEHRARHDADPLPEAHLRDNAEPPLEEEEGKAEKKKKKRRRHKPRSATPEVDRSRHGRRRPSTDESDGGGHKAKRHGKDKGADMVWIKVPRASLQAK